MATSSSTVAAPSVDAGHPFVADTPGVLVCLPSLSAENESAALEKMRASFGGRQLLVAGASALPVSPEVQAVEYASPRSQLGWVLAAADYSAAAATLQAHPSVDVVLLLSGDLSTLPYECFRELADRVREGADLAVPRYPVGPHDGLVSSAILYPLTRALFSVDVRFPLPVDAAISPRLLERLAVTARRNIAQGSEALLWPASEAATAYLRTVEIQTPERTLPSPPDTDLSSLLSAVAGSLFSDIETKAAFWQRGRAVVPTVNPSGTTPDQSAFSAADNEEVRSLVENFRLATSNLTELWSLVLPPQTLLAIRKLARSEPEQFVFDPSVWARVMYDFALAFHLRTINRGHLLGAMTPLYLAWVASHIRSAQNDAARAIRLTEATAQAFEREKPYFVSRWRWPDRFNP